jgi:hypothetical protein
MQDVTGILPPILALKMLILSQNHGFNVISKKKIGKNRNKFIPGIDKSAEISF